MKKLLKKRAILEQVPKVAEGVAPSNPLNISVNQSALIMAKVNTQHDAFLTMCNSERFPIEQTIINWWPAAFGEPFPSDCTLSVQECKVRIQYQLMYLGYHKNGVTPPERFNGNYKKYFEGTPNLLRQCENEYILSKVFINKQFSEEGQMVKKEPEVKVAKVKKEPEVKVAKVKKEPEVKVAKVKKEKKEKVPTAERVTKRSIAFAAILQQKFTDEEILQKIREVYPDTPDCALNDLHTRRQDINTGKYPGNKGKPPIERLFRVDEKLIKKSAMPQAEKKPTRVKVDPTNDPLKKIAGIDTSKKVVNTSNAPKHPTQIPVASTKKVTVKKGTLGSI